MEDDLNIFENGRRPQLFFCKEDDLNFFEKGKRPKKKLYNPKQLKVKTIIVLKMEDDLKFLKTEDGLKKKYAVKNNKK
jgi:hypothetical protein